MWSTEKGSLAGEAHMPRYALSKAQAVRPLGIIFEILHYIFPALSISIFTFCLLTN